MIRVATAFHLAGEFYLASPFRYEAKCFHNEQTVGLAVELLYRLYHGMNRWSVFDLPSLHDFDSNFYKILVYHFENQLD